MPETPKADTPKVNAAVPAVHDRVAVLSVRADGTHDQLNPELIDPEGARDYTRRQFAEQAVGAVDRDNAPAPGPVTIVGTPDGEADKVIPATEAVQDPSVATAKAEHEKAQKAAEAAADRAIGSLSRES